MGFQKADDFVKAHAEAGQATAQTADFERVYGDVESICNNEICRVSHVDSKGKTKVYSIRLTTHRRLADNVLFLFVEGVNDTPGSKTRGKAAGLKSPVGRVMLGTAASIQDPAVGAKHFAADFVDFAK